MKSKGTKHPTHVSLGDVTPLPTPAELEQKHLLTDEAAKAILASRQQIIDILEGKDKRMIVIVGPCSEDDSIQPDGTPSVVKFAQEIQKLAADQAINSKLHIVMRCNPAKPRTELGMAGLEQKDVTIAHKLLTDIANLQVPLAIEVMTPEHIARYGHLISLCWVGARNNRDTVIRHALSAYPQLPTLVKNDEYGELKPALQAVNTIAQPHDNARITLPDGRTAYVHRTTGNPNTGIVWRGGGHYMSPAGFELGIQKTAQTGLPYAVDCSHGNTAAHGKDHHKTAAAQKECFDHLIELIKSGNLPSLPKAIMIESYLQEGNDTSCQSPGKSWTDPCISLEDTKAMIRTLCAKSEARL